MNGDDRAKRDPTLSPGADGVCAGRFRPASDLARGGTAISAALSAAILAAMCLVAPACIHWFAVPVLLCGTVIGVDALHWCRGRYDIFDPRGVIGVVGYYAFFIAPLLHVALDSWMREINENVPWREWLGGMAILNVLGLLVYRWVTERARDGIRRRKSDERRSLHVGWFLALVGVAAVASGVAQFVVYDRFGGILGYILAFEARDMAFRGMGLLFTLSEGLPILLFLGYAAVVRWKKLSPSWATLLLVLLAVFVLLLLFGGLRGSRSNTVWRLFWAVGVVHLWIRRIPRSLAMVGILLLAAFLYSYAFYKSGGMEGLADLRDPDARVVFEDRMQRGVKDMLLGDLGRADVHAFLLYALWGPDRDYDYALGRTYVGALAQLIPRSVWPDRPPTKVLEGTEIQRGRGSFRGSEVLGLYSTRVYGITGEAMLNFGPLAVPFALALLGLVVGILSGLLDRWAYGDPRLLLYPFLVNLCLVLLVLDSDNALFFVVKNGMIPGLILALSTTIASGRRTGQPWTDAPAKRQESPA